MSSLISHAGITEAIEALGVNPDTLKGRLLNALHARLDSDEALATITALAADDLIATVWQTDDPAEIKKKRKNFSSLKSALNKDLKELDEAGRNPESLLIGKDNIFEVSAVKKNELLSQMGVTARTDPELAREFASFRREFGQIAEERGWNRLEDLLAELDQQEQRVLALASQLKENSEQVARLSDELTAVREESNKQRDGADGATGFAGSGEEFEIIELGSDDLIEEELIEEEITEIDGDDLIEEVEGKGAEDSTPGNGEGASNDGESAYGTGEDTEEEGAGEKTGDEDSDRGGLGASAEAGTEEVVEEIDEDNLIEEVEADADADESAAGDLAGEAREEITEEVVEEIDEDDLIEEVEADEADDLLIATPEADNSAAGDLAGEAREEIIEEETEEVTEEVVEEIDADDLIEEVEADEADDLLIATPEADNSAAGDLAGEAREEITEEVVEEIDEDNLIEEVEADADADESAAGDLAGEAREEIIEEETEEITEETEEVIEEIDEDDLIEEVEADEADVSAADDLAGEKIEEIIEEETEEITEETEEVIEEIDEDDLIEVLEDDENSPDPLGPVSGASSGLLDALSEYIEADDALSDQETLRESHEEYIAHILERFTPKFIHIPAGNFIVGASHPKALEQQEKTVPLPSFYIGQVPVTNDLFDLFVRETGYQTDAERAGYGIVYSGRYQNKIDRHSGKTVFSLARATSSQNTEGASWRYPLGPTSSIEGLHNHPVVQISRPDAIAFAAWAGKRLPTEEEWEAAARGMDGRLFPWGNTWLPRLANLESSMTGGTSEVNHHGPKSASPFGILDLIGNIWEWTASRHEMAGTSRAKVYLLKGGSWISSGSVTVSQRMIEQEKHWSNIIGFRCAV